MEARLYTANKICPVTMVIFEFSSVSKAENSTCPNNAQNNVSTVPSILLKEHVQAIC